MFKRVLYFLLFLCFCMPASAQKEQSSDSLAYYNDLFTELDSFLDSLTTPRSMLLINVGMNNSFFSGEGSDRAKSRERKITLTPSLGYFHKSGFGLNAGAFINSFDEGSFQPYQYALTGSFDYLTGHSLISGISLTRYLTPDSVSFYTSPLETEANMYLVYKRSWLKPSLSFTYAWGTKTGYEERQDFLPNLRSRRPPGTTVVTTEERLADFSVTAALKHDFSWLDAMGAKSVIRFTPQLAFTSGTQRFGFNQNTTSSLFKGNSPNVLYNSQSVELNESSRFQPVSLTAFLKGGFTKGAFALQPQLLFDYYFPAEENKLTAGFVINAVVVID